MKWTRVLMVTAIVLAMTAPATPAAAATTDVSMSQAAGFSPSVVRGRVGDAVTWHKTEGYHNVMSTQGMFTSGSPTESEFTFTRVFSAGVFPYMCAVHPQQMQGSVRIKPRAADGPAGTPFRVSWASSATDTGDRFTVRYKVGDGTWRTWRSSTAARSAVFGRDGNPVAAVAGTTYRFKVKSRSGDDASSYSPVIAFTP